MRVPADATTGGHPVAVSAAGAGLLAGLALSLPPARLPGQLVAGSRAADGGVALLSAAAGTALWLVVGWLALSLAAAYAARLPGAAGRAGRAVCRRVTPAVVRRLVGGGAAVGLALGPVLLPTVARAADRPTVTTAQGAHRPVSAGCAPETGLPSLDRPAPGPDVAGPVPTACSPSAALPTARTPIARTPAAAAPPASTTRPSQPTPTHLPALPPTRSATSRTGAVTVTAGDTLWGLAVAELYHDGLTPTPERVAGRWPAWWAANRAEIGGDPALLHPGEVLRPPAAPPT